MNAEELIRQVLDVRSSSGAENLMAICPFHTKDDGRPESTPSFAINRLNGMWICHSCHEAGSLRSLLKGLGFSYAEISGYATLLDGLKPIQLSPIARGKAVDRAGFSNTPIPDHFLGLFNYLPLDLLEAGFTAETLDHFEVGFDPNHSRITFPIRDVSGRLIAISGRCIDGSQPRYKIYTKEYKVWGLPEKEELIKSDIIWHMNDVYPRVSLSATPGKLFVVEGFKAAMWLWQHGVKNVVALLGSFLSEAQLTVLAHLGSKIMLFLDNDQAGVGGAKRALKELSGVTFAQRVKYPTRLLSDSKAQPDLLTPDEIAELCL